MFLPWVLSVDFYTQVVQPSRSGTQQNGGKSIRRTHASDILSVYVITPQSPARCFSGSPSVSSLLTASGMGPVTKRERTGEFMKVRRTSGPTRLENVTYRFSPTPLTPACSSACRPHSAGAKGPRSTAEPPSRGKSADR